jgi:hypothetical protein
VVTHFFDECQESRVQLVEFEVMGDLLFQGASFILLHGLANDLDHAKQGPGLSREFQEGE